MFAREQTVEMTCFAVPVMNQEPAQQVARLLSLQIELEGKFTSGDQDRVRQRPLRLVRG